MGQVCTYILAALLYNYIRHGAGMYIHPCSIAVQLYQEWGRYVHTPLQHCYTTISDMGHVCTYILAALLHNYIRYGAGMYIHPCSIAVQLYQIWGMYVHTSLQHCCTTISDIGQVHTYIFAALLCNYIRYGAGTYIHPCSVAVQLYQIWGRYIHTYIFAALLYNYIRYGAGMYIHPCSMSVQLYQIWGRYVHTSLQHCCTTISDMGQVHTYIFAALLCNYIRYGAGTYIHTSLQHCCATISDMGQVRTYIFAALLWNYIRYGAGTCMSIHPCSIDVQLYQIWGRYVHTSLQHCCTTISNMGQVHVCTYILAALMYNCIRYVASTYILPCSIAVQLYQIWGRYEHTSLQQCCTTISDMGQVCAYIVLALLYKYMAGMYVNICPISDIEACTYIHANTDCCTTISDIGQVCTYIIAALPYNYIRYGAGMCIHPFSIAV